MGCEKASGNFGFMLNRVWNSSSDQSYQRTIVAAAVAARVRFSEYRLGYSTPHGQWTSHAYILLNSPTHSSQTKHMDIRIKFCGEVLAKRQKIALKYVPTKLNFVDIFTKPLATARFRELRGILVQNLDGIVYNSKFLHRTFAFLKDFMTTPFSQ